MTIETITRPDIESGVWTLDKAHTKVGFVAKHLMVSKVRGSFEGYESTIEVADDLTESRIEVVLDATTITTGAVDRDAHLRSEDFLDVDNHPTLRFVSTDIVREDDDWRITGDLTIRGITRPVTLSATYQGAATDPWGNTHVGFEASTRVDREDWGLTWNAALEGGGWLVSKDILIEIEGQLIKS